MVFLCYFLPHPSISLAGPIKTLLGTYCAIADAQAIDLVVDPLQGFLQRDGCLSAALARHGQTWMGKLEQRFRKQLVKQLED